MASPAAHILAWLLAGTLLGCGPSDPSGAPKGEPSRPAAAAPPSLLLVTLDTWRWDYLGASGSGKVRTPYLDTLAQEGLYFAKAQTTCPLTTPAHASILTGLQPSKHGVRDNLHFKLQEGVSTLAEVLSKAGYSTGAVVSGAPLRRMYGLDRGFAQYEDGGLGPEGDDSIAPSSRPAPETTKRALRMAAQWPAGRPVFLWVHYYDAHFPYEPPSEYRAAYPQDLYAGEIAALDAAVRELVTGLKAARPGAWTVCVTGDHGESLGEHAEDTHGIGLYEATLQVPLLLHPKIMSSIPPGPASLLDLFPTLLTRCGVTPPACDGRDLAAKAAGARWLAAESAFPTLAFGLNPNLGLRREDLVWFHHGADEVYDLARDPSQLHDLSKEAPGRAFIQEARPQLAAAFGADPAAAMRRVSLSLAPRELGALQGLGYLQGGASRDPIQKADLTLFLREFQRLNEARTLARTPGQKPRAATVFRAFLSNYSRSPLLWREYGTCLLGTSDLSGATRAFETALALDSADAVSALNLGNLAVMGGDAARAEKLFLQSLAAEEQQAEAHLNLGLLYGQYLKRPGEALPHLRRFLELAPEDPEASQIRSMVAELSAGAPK